MSLVWINGELVDKSLARISPFDHGFLYGDGVWEHFRAFGGKLFRPEKGIATLYDSLLRYLAINISLSQSELIAAIEATVRANNREEGYVRVIVTRGAGTLGPDPRKLESQVIIIAEEYHPFPLELYEHGLHATISQGYDPANTAHHSHTLGALYLVWAKQKALAAGCLEAIIFWQSEVIRGIEGNLFLVRSGKVFPLDGGGYELLLDLVPQLAEADGVSVERDLNQILEICKHHYLMTSDEVFLAGTSCGVIGIVRVDGTAIASGKEGPITKRIREAYRKLTRGEA